MTLHISANWDQLLDDAMRTTSLNFSRAERILQDSDREYTTKDVIELTRIMTYEFRTAAIKVSAQDIAEAVDRLATSVREDSYD